MPKVVPYALAFGALLSTSSVSIAQNPVGQTFCGLYKQVVEQGQEALIGLRGTPVAGGRWEVKDVSVPGGKCFIRSPANAESLACSIVQESVEDAKTWATDMATTSRECLNALGGFAEREDRDEKDGGKVERTTWHRKLGDGALRISILTIVRDDGKTQNRMQINLNRKDG